MPKVGFISLGCKVNSYEANALEEQFIEAGYQVVEPSDLCDVFVINTCSVTNTADQKSRQMIAKCRKLNPNSIVVAMGCYIQTSKNIDVDADIIIGNGNKEKTIDLINRVIKDKTKIVDIIDISKKKDYDDLLVSTYDHSRAFIKIQDGCNQYCSYCIIPYARGPIRSKNADLVIKEIKNVISNGFNEVVLSGIHTGKYKDNDYKLSDLIERILKETSLKRLRLSSIEINEIDDKLLKLMSESKVLADHLHLPLQSGSDEILSLMNRPYKAKDFLAKVEDIRHIRPNISLTTDVIVGFPKESEELYKETLDFIKLVNFSYLHVFPYSKRAGTKAASMEQVNPIIKKIRSKELNELSLKLRENYYKSNLGNIEEVIFEQRDKEYLIGHTSNFITVKVKTDDDSLIKKLVKIKLDYYKEQVVYASFI